jgi:hypothetical protein
VQNYDRVTVRRKITGTTFTFKKDINGVMIVIEQMRTTEGTFSFFNIFIRKR